jgi:hypothetical protein
VELRNGVPVDLGAADAVELQRDAADEDELQVVFRLSGPCYPAR